MHTPSEQCDPDVILAEAIDRGVRVEFHRFQSGLLMPVASARLVSADGQHLYLDEPHVIGKSIKLSTNADYECYFRLNDELYYFDGTLEATKAKVDLNNAMRTLGVVMKRPAEVRVRQRRQNFRVSLVQESPIRVMLHRAGADRPDAAPLGSRLDEGHLIDASAAGFAIRVDRPIRDHELSVFDRLFISFIVPEPHHEVRVLTELRQIRRVLDNRSTRLGLMALPWPSHGYLSRATMPLDRYIASVQRKWRAA